MPALTQLGRSGSTERAGRVPPGREGSAASGSSVLAGVLGFFVYLLKMIIVFFFHKGTSIFAKERGKLFQLKQDKNLSSWGDPGFSFSKCVFAKCGMAVLEHGV